MIRHLGRLGISRVASRTYLTASHQCKSAWEARLSQCPTLAKISPRAVDKFYADVETKHQQQRKVSAIDVDIFVNLVTEDNYVDEMADILHKLRNTAEASNILESTSHAFVRNLTEHNQIDFLLQILRDPLNYGIFLDTFSANLLLDKLLEEKKFTAAAEVASFLMLQEDFGDEITKAMSLLASYKYLDNPEPFIKPEAAPQPDKTAAAAPPPPAKGKKGKKEEVRVRVKFLRNEFFDDHFDLREPKHLVGKTLVRLSSELPKNFQSSSKLLGLCLYEKYAEAVKFIDQLTKQDTIHKEVLERAQKALEEKPSESEEYKQLLEKITTIGEKVSVVEESFENTVTSLIKSATEKLEKDSISKQEETYKKWIQVREQNLQDELLRLKRAAKVKEFEQVAKDMEMEEKKLWYFENEEQIELEIESKQVRYPKRWFGKKKKPRVIDEGYVPPEIIVKRNR